jgi:hypothetical protein
MLRIKYTMGIAALFLLQASSSFAAEGNHQDIVAPYGHSVGIAQTGDGLYRTAASKIQGDQLAGADVALQQKADQSRPASDASTMEYPALALLAMAIISMAALSRRDSFKIDR